MNKNPLVHLSIMILCLVAGFAQAQVVGTTTVGAVLEQVDAIGLSAKKQIIGRTIFNEDGAKVGRVDDLIVAPDDAVSFAVVGVGGFVGVGRHRVAIPINFLTSREGGFLLVGATREAIKALPEFEYARPIDRGIVRDGSWHR